LAYRLVCPLRSLCLELGTVADLQRPRGSPGKEVGDLLPGEVLVLLEIDEKLVVFGRKLEFWSARSWGRCWHAHLPHDTWGAASTARQAPIPVTAHHLGRGPLIW
jgi:hypothetical protein